MKQKSDGKGEDRKEDVVEENKNEGKSETDDDTKEQDDDAKKGSEYVNSELQPKSDGKGEERKEDVVDENKKEGKSETDEIKSEELVQLEEIAKKEDKKDSLDEIYVNTEKTLEEIEDIKKHVRFNLEPEDMDMVPLQPNGLEFSVEIGVGEIVNKLFVVEESDKKDEEKIDEEYVNFPSSQANAKMFFDEMKKKEENRYKVETEDISEPESEHTENMEKTMDLILPEQKTEKDNNDIEHVKESEEVEEKEGSEEIDKKENNEGIVAEKILKKMKKEI